MAKKQFDQVKVRQIQEWLLQGQLVTDILRNIIAKWELTENQGMEHISAAFEDFTDQVTKNYPEVKAFHIQMRMNLYKKAFEDKQYKLAHDILKDVAKLQDLS